MKRYKVMCWQEISIKEPDGGITHEGEWVPWSDDWLPINEALEEFGRAVTHAACKIIEEDFAE